MATEELQVSQEQADAMMATARSPMERANDAVFDKGGQSATDAPDFGKDLEAARNNDKARSEGKAPPETPAVPPEQKQQKAEVKTEQKQGLEWKPTDKRKAAQWDEVKGAAAKREQELLAQIEALKQSNPNSNPFDHPEVKKLKEQHDKFYDIVKQVSVENDPEFQAKYNPKKEAVIKAAKWAAGGAADELAKVLAMPDNPMREQKLNELMEGFSEGTKRKINAALSTLEQIEMERTAEIEGRKATWESRQAQAFQQNQMQQRQREEQIKDSFNKVLSKWQDPNNGMPFTIPSGENASKAQHIVDNAGKILFGNDPNFTTESLAESALKAATFDEVLNGWHQSEIRYQQLQQEYDKLRGVNPDLGDASGIDAGQDNVDYRDPRYVGSFQSQLEAARQSDASRGWR